MVGVFHMMEISSNSLNLEESETGSKIRLVQKEETDATCVFTHPTCVPNLLFSTGCRDQFLDIDQSSTVRHWNVRHWNRLRSVYHTL